MLKLIASTVVVLAALAIGEPAKASSSSALVNVQTGKCLDILSVSTAPGAISQQFDCLGSGNQLWYTEVVSYQSASAIVRFVSVNSGLCLDIASGALGAQVIQNVCNGVGTQRWVVSAPYAVASLPGYGLITQISFARAITNLQTGQCLDASEPGSNGGPIQQYTCGSRMNQRWYVNIF